MCLVLEEVSPKSCSKHKIELRLLYAIRKAFRRNDDKSKKGSQENTSKEVGAEFNINKTISIWILLSSLQAPLYQQFCS